jgi:hypothetical protein
MTEIEFKSLCRDLSRELGQADCEALGERGRIQIDGVDIALFFDEQDSPDLLYCYVDMGPIPEASRLLAWEQLLVMNLLSGAKTNGVYSLDPASGNGLFVVHFMLPERLEADMLAAAFRVYARQVSAFRAALDEGEGEGKGGAPDPETAAMAGRTQFFSDLA